MVQYINLMKVLLFKYYYSTLVLVPYHGCPQTRIRYRYQDFDWVLTYRNAGYNKKLFSTTMYKKWYVTTSSVVLR